eukprot:Pgem_evm1s19222
MMFPSVLAGFTAAVVSANLASGIVHYQKNPFEQPSYGFTYANESKEMPFQKQMQSEPTIRPVQGMELDSYMGRWYQVMTNQFTATRMEKLEKCITMDYFAAPNGKVELVKSSNLIFDSVMKMQTLVEADIPNPAFPSKWSLPVGGLRKIEGTNFWVVKLGPKVENKYEYSVVTDPMGQSLFVLARDVQKFHSMYKQEVMQSLVKVGLTGLGSRQAFLSTPVETSHVNCNYSPLPPRPVTEVDFEDMTGHWYELYQNVNVDLEMQLPVRSKCTVSNVKKVSKNQMQCTVTTQTGLDKLHQVRSFYQIPDLKKPGELIMSKETQTTMPMAPVQNLIIKLGPQIDGQYQYAIISDPLREMVKVIVRNINQFDSKYK